MPIVYKVVSPSRFKGEEDIAFSCVTARPHVKQVYQLYRTTKCRNMFAFKTLEQAKAWMAIECGEDEIWMCETPMIIDDCLVRALSPEEVPETMELVQFYWSQLQSNWSLGYPCAEGTVLCHEVTPMYVAYPPRQDKNYSWLQPKGENV